MSIGKAPIPTTTHDELDAENEQDRKHGVEGERGHPEDQDKPQSAQEARVTAAIAAVARLRD